MCAPTSSSERDRKITIFSMAATKHHEKLRVLCIHGFRTSGTILHKQLSRWDSSITDKLDMCFLDGPLPATGKSEIEGIFPPPYYEWFQYNKDFTKFKNLDKAFPLIVEYMEQNGPFHGLLGFSQGAMLCAALVCYQLQGIMLQNHPRIRFIISISGIKFRDPQTSFLYNQPIKCPSVHITGAKDYVKEFSKDLIQAFQNPLVVTHPKGHIIPKLERARKILPLFAMAAITNEKLRVLCIHVFRTSGTILHKQLSRWDSSITDKLDMCFLDGPLPAAGKSEIEGILPPPYYEWFQYNKDFTKFKNLDKAFPLIVDYMEQNGPFDGLLGFSQGAMLCAALVCYQSQGIMLQNHPRIRFIISISGIKFRDPQMSFLYNSPIKCPSVHITGAKDYVKEFSKDLIQAFQNPLVITHPKGHIVPKLDSQAVKPLQQFIESIMKQNQKKHSIHAFLGGYAMADRMTKGDVLLHSKL